jgi:hypothetical protein
MRLLHVANGTSTTGTIHAAGIPGSTSIWADPLHEGPVPGLLTDEQLLDVRARHLAGGGIDAADAIDELRRWREAIDNLASYDELVLWYEHDLFDQLNLIQLLSRIGQGSLRTRSVSLICIGAFPGHPRFRGLGELSPGELGSLFDTRQRVSDAQYDAAARAWNAFRAPDPLALEALLATDTSALPFLATALRRHLQEYPWSRDGLSRTERRLMTLAEPGPIDIGNAFPLMHEDETAFYIADSSFWQVAQELESARPSLITVAATSTAPNQLPAGTIALTDAGQAVLNAQLDRVERCGIDRWLGGVHLVSSEPMLGMWRWDEAQRRIRHYDGRHARTDL